MRKKRRIVSDTYEGDIRNVGLVETINKAAGSLQKDQNLSDIPDKAQARNALQLGTAATATLTTSTTDDATGRVLKVGDRGLGKVTIPALRGFDFYQYWFAAGETLFIETNSAINFPPGMPEFANTYVYVNVVGIRDSGNDCALLLSRYDTNISYLAWRIHEANTSINWRVLKIPTAAADIRAIPKDPIGTIGNNGRMASADTPGWWLVSVADAGTVADFPQYPNGNRLYSYGFMFVARSGNVWLQQYFSHTGASASRQTWNGDMSERTPWVIDYSTANKPTATDVGALPITGGGLNGNLGIGTTNALGGNSIVLGDDDTGFKQNGDGVLDAYSNSRQVMRIAPGAVQVFGSTGMWIHLREQICFSNVTPVNNYGASAIVRQEHQDRHFILGGLGNHQFGIYMINKSRSENGTDGQAYLDENGDWVCGGQILPGSYANFDARYQPKDNYATQAWVLQNFVQNIRQSGVAYIDAEKNSGQRLVPAGGVLIGSQVNGEWDNNEGFYYTWIQQNINGNWLTIGRV
ncbi:MULTISPECIES: hypothetical protein [Citrobacter]|uniref:hypothetical protein n=1 Tax=Citrobacter TaxID=544 RepID=UPI00227A0A86|nr:hypothetical protein [Citrobacter sp. W4]